MPKQKMKTKSSAKRRFKITGSGKLMRMHGLKSHFRRRRAPRTKRAFDKMVEVEPTNRSRIRRLLPYGL